MLFKSKNDQDSIDRAQQMYGAGINRGLAGFANLKQKKSTQIDPQQSVVVTTTDRLAETYSHVVAVVSAEGVTVDQAVTKLQQEATKAGARAVLTMRVISHGDHLLAYGTAVK